MHTNKVPGKLMSGPYSLKTKVLGRSPSSVALLAPGRLVACTMFSVLDTGSSGKGPLQAGSVQIDSCKRLLHKRTVGTHSNRLLETE